MKKYGELCECYVCKNGDYYEESEITEMVLLNRGIKYTSHKNVGCTSYFFVFCIVYLTGMGSNYCGLSCIKL